MKIKVDMTKENIKILQNIKSNNPSDISFKVSVEDSKVEIEFERLEIRKVDYIDINNSFLETIKNSLIQSEAKYSTYTKKDAFIIEEITEKKVLVVLTIENTLALEELKEKYPNKTQMDILNELFELGYKELINNIRK